MGGKGRDGCAVVICNGDEGCVPGCNLFSHFGTDSLTGLLFPRVGSSVWKSARCALLRLSPLSPCSFPHSLDIQEHASETWTDILGWHQGEVVIEEDGWGDFSCSARSVSVWVKDCAKGREEFRRK
jgi:hypothetical protein